MSSRRQSLLVIVAALSIGALAGGAQPPGPGATAGVESFLPEGTAHAPRQVTARFRSDMVALGDPNLPQPFDVDCPVKGVGHWLDARTWIYDFDSDLESGLRCRFRLRAGAKALDGTALAPASHGFDTGGPAVERALPAVDGVADEAQAFILRFDGEPDPASLAGNAWCVIDGLAERVPMLWLTGAPREQVLAQRAKLGYEYFQLFFKDGETGFAQVRSRAMEKSAGRLLQVARCARPLPPGTRVQLVIGAGVRSVAGVAGTEAQQLGYTVRAAFEVRMECERANADSGCLPMRPIHVAFSASVPRELLAGVQLRDASGHAWPADKLPAAPVADGLQFSGPFPEGTQMVLELPKGLHDDAGRTAVNAARFPLRFTLGDYPPLAKFSGNFGIVELREGGVLPVTLRAIEPGLAASAVHIEGRSLRLDGDVAAIHDWLERVVAAGRPRGEYEKAAPGERPQGALKPKLEDQDEAGDDPNQDAAGEKLKWREDTGDVSVFTAHEATARFDLPAPGPGHATEVVGLPLAKPGFYVLEVASRVLGSALLGREQPRHVATAALVTDLAVHLEWGRESSLVWVTRLHDGSVVADAEVQVAQACSGHPLWHGRTGKDGVARIEETLGDPSGYGSCQWGTSPLMALARVGDDFSFTLSSWSEGIRPFEFNLRVGGSSTGAIYHTVLDRTLFRAGETVSMKHVLRRHDDSGVSLLDKSLLPAKLEIVHVGSDQHYELPVEFGRDGVATTRWAIPAEAKLGDYRVLLAGNESGGFKVGEFRLPLMHGEVTGPARTLVRPASVPLDLHVSYQSGGGATGLQARLRTLVEPRAVSFPGYEEWDFSDQPVSVGQASSGSRWTIDAEQSAGEGDEPADDVGPQPARRVRTQPVVLDRAGSARVLVDSLPELAGASQLTAELEYDDPNGQRQTVSTHVRLAPSELVLAIRREGWFATRDQLRFRVLVLDAEGKPRAGQKVDVHFYTRETYSWRRRLVGGFYAYDSVVDTQPAKASCSGTSDAQGLLLCDVAPGVEGNLVFRAQARDGAGRVAGVTSSVWIAGAEDQWFGGTSGDRMDVLPERREYEAGQVARLQVRMPFRAATALVTIEREGVLRSYVRELSGKDPVIEVPIEAADAPNVFVSVLAVRGRIPHAEDPAAAKRAGGEVTGLVDLTRPAYRLGVAMLRVGWQPHRLGVQVTTDRSQYRVREQASVRVHVTAPAGAALPAGSEVAVAAVDESLLDLAANDSWKLLEAMMGERGIEVYTSTAQTQVVGKRHYGRKAVSHGGGGGRDRARELFDSLLAWSPRVPLDADGNATIKVPLNDSLSAFRIVAIAQGGPSQSKAGQSGAGQSGAGLFGTGETRITTSQDLVLLPGLPPLVRAGDGFAATFTVRNTTDHSMDVHLAVDGALAPIDISVPAGEARDASWQVTAPLANPKLAWDVTATAKDGSARDHVKLSQQVIQAIPVRTYQATLEQLRAPLTLPVAAPALAQPGRGGVELHLQARLAGSLDGVREFMWLYPWNCLEQQVSRAIVDGDAPGWESLASRFPAYLDRDGLLRYFPTDALMGDEVLTAYVLDVANEAGWQVPDATRERMLSGLKLFVAGRLTRPAAYDRADIAIRRLSAIEALSRYDEATPAMLEPLRIDVRQLPTSAILDWIGILRHLPAVPKSEQRMAAAYAELRGRLDLRGTTLNFSTEHTDALWWLMITSDVNANRLVLAGLDWPAWSNELPRLVRGSLGRQDRGHWNTTVANAWGMLAMRAFSARFESTAVAGETSASYGRESRKLAWKPGVDPAPQSLAWQAACTPITLTHAGAGAPWAMLRFQAALPLQHPDFNGIKVVRTLVPLERAVADSWTRGDVVRVHLEMEAQSDLGWVALEDPVPAGASILGGGLGNESALLQHGEQRKGWAWPAFEERRFEGYRAYYRFVPKGSWSLDYTIRLNNSGTFQLPATRVEAMYAPETYGETPNAPWVVKPLP